MSLCKGIVNIFTLRLGYKYLKKIELLKSIVAHIPWYESRDARGRGTLDTFVDMQSPKGVSKLVGLRAEAHDMQMLEGTTCSPIS